MFQYEAYNIKADNCIKKAREFSEDERLVDFFKKAAKGFKQRAQRLTLAEAMDDVEENQILKADWQ
jgi:hypothetical protein